MRIEFFPNKEKPELPIAKIVDKNIFQASVGMYYTPFVAQFRQAVVAAKVRNLLTENPLSDGEISNSIDRLHEDLHRHAFTILMAISIPLVSSLIGNIESEEFRNAVFMLYAIFVHLTAFVPHFTEPYILNSRSHSLIKTNIIDIIDYQNKGQFQELFQVIGREISQEIRAEIDMLEYYLANPNLNSEQRADLQTKIADQVRKQQELDSKIVNVRTKLSGEINRSYGDWYLTRPQENSSNTFEEDEDEVDEEEAETTPETVIAKVTQTVQATS
jgi:hypothetical protein